MKLKSIRYRGIRALNASIHPYKADIPKGTTDFVIPFAELDVGDVNLIIGENGSGKSSVIDMVRACAFPEILATLVRENPIGYCPPAYSLNFQNGHRATYSFPFVPFDLDLSIDFAGCETSFFRGGQLSKPNRICTNMIPPNTGNFPLLFCARTNCTIDTVGTWHRLSTRNA
ncbi:hypothetical protein V9L16_17860 [Pseudomonas tolaasii]|uniref:hypothetical protein n=1 Tax=Pseudomonas tolaasii TaxID=29442 RepID=UPI0030CB443B